jgi:predicted permease
MRAGTRLRRWWERRRLESDLAEELRTHIEMAEARLREQGVTKEEARIQARRQFGNQTLAFEESRAEWRFALLDELSQDVRYAVRTWRRSPGFALVIVTTIGLALGLNTALFTAFDHYVLRPLAVRDPDSLYQVEWKTKRGAGHFFTWQEYQRLTEQEHILSGSFAAAPVLRQLDQQPALGYLVTADFFQMLEVKMALGRPFTPADAAAPGTGAYVVLGHTCWKSRYGADPLIIGRKVFVRGQPFDVIGVAGPEFTGIGPAPADFWAPLTMYAALNDGTDLFSPSTTGTLLAVVRLRSDVSLDIAKTMLLSWSREQTREYPDDEKAVGIYTESRSTAVPLNRNVILLFAPVFVAFGLVLVTACANVSNMMLARAVMRQREIGTRLSLGAGRLRLLRQLLAEAFLLSLAAAAAGFVISETTIRMLRHAVYATLPSQFSRIVSIPDMQRDYRVFGFIALTAVATTFLFGLLPALQATRTSVSSAIRGDFGSHLRSSRLRNALVVVQALVCTLLLITSLVMLSSEARLAQRDLRVDARGVLDVRVSSKMAERIAELLRTESIVESMAAVSRAPLYGGLPALGISAGQEAGFVRSYFNLVSDEYFRVMRIPLVAGRIFTPQESRAHGPVAIVSEATARRLWPNESPLGKEIRINADRRNRLFASPAFSNAQVVGVARDVVNGYATSAVDTACVYFPVAAGSSAITSVLVRVHGNAEAARVVLERAIQEAAPGASDLITSLEQVVETGVYPLRLMLWMGTFLASLAMLLVITGIYGVLSFVVNQRRKEIGICLAVGASRRQIVAMILGRSIRLALLGAALGATLALAVAPVFANRIDTIRSFEPAAYTIAIGIVLIAAAAAGLMPSYRASVLDPASTLRND